MLPGVKDTVLNPRIGSMLVLYDADVTTPKEIQRWMNAVEDTGLEFVRRDRLADGGGGRARH